MKTVTLRHLLSDTTRVVHLEGVDPFDRAVKIRFGGAGVYRFSWEDGQGVEREVEQWVINELDGLREHVRSIGLETGPRLEPRLPRKLPRQCRPRSIDPRQVTLALGDVALSQVDRAQERLTMGARRHRFGGAR